MEEIKDQSNKEISEPKPRIGRRKKQGLIIAAVVILALVVGTIAKVPFLPWVDSSNNEVVNFDQALTEALSKIDDGEYEAAEEQLNILVESEKGKDDYRVYAGLADVSNYTGSPKNDTKLKAEKAMELYQKSPNQIRNSETMLRMKNYSLGIYIPKPSDYNHDNNTNEEQLKDPDFQG